MTECSPLLSDAKKRLHIEDFISPKEARRIIELLNTFRKDKTKLAFDRLFFHFVWEPNNLKPLRDPLNFIEVVPDERYMDKDVDLRRDGDGDDDVGYPWLRSVEDFEEAGAPAPPSHKKGIDTIHTAATDGSTLWINRKNIMNKAFDRRDTHFGPLPPGVSHFSAVMLHEFGHVLRKRAKHTTIVRILRNSPDIRLCYNEFQEDKELARKVRDKDLYSSISDEMEEWFADIFAKSFILLADNYVEEAKQHDERRKDFIPLPHPSRVRRHRRRTTNAMLYH